MVGNLENIDDLASRGTGLGYIYIYIVDFLLVTDATENVGVQDVAVRGHELL